MTTRRILLAPIIVSAVFLIWGAFYSSIDAIFQELRASTAQALVGESTFGPEPVQVASVSQPLEIESLATSGSTDPTPFPSETAQQVTATTTPKPQPTVAVPSPVSTQTLAASTPTQTVVLKDTLSGPENVQQSAYAAPNTLSQQGNQFALSFWREAAPEYGNFIYASYGIYRSLVALSYGSRGNTYDQISAVINPSGGTMPDCQLDPSQSEAIYHTSFWYSKEIQLGEAFQSHLSNCFGPFLQIFEFPNANDINANVNQYAPFAVSPVSLSPNIPMDGLVTVSFLDLPSSTWNAFFDQADSIDRPFRYLNGEAITASYYRKAGQYRLYEDEGYQALVLPSASPDISMLIIRPLDQMLISDFLETLSAEDVQQIKAKASLSSVEVWIPAFTIKQTLNLVDAVVNGGSADLFFPGVAEIDAQLPEGSPYVAGLYSLAEINFRHAIEDHSIKVNRLGSAYVPDLQADFHFRVDRPFAVVVWNQTTDAVLGLGRVVVP